MDIKNIIQFLDPKSKIVLRNVSYSFFIKGMNILINFLTLPLILSYLDTTRYGIWLTMSAILTWFSLFDLGLGNGLRNRLTIALANENYEDAKIYVSTTYIILSVIFSGLLLLFIIINPYVDWLKVFNAPEILKDEITFAVLICISCIFFQLVLRLVNTVLLSLQKAAMADLLNATVQLIIFLGLCLLKFQSNTTLKSVTTIFAVVTISVFFLASIYLFSTRLSFIRPTFNSFRKVYIKNLLSLSINFFLIQIAALVLYASDNFLITQLFTPADVSVYNVAYKYFSITNLALTIVLPSFWSMTTKAFAENDFYWIKNSVNKLLLIWCILAVVGVVQLLVSDSIYHVWIDGKVKVPFVLSICMLIYYMVFNFTGIFSNFLNAVGKTRIQLYYALFAMIINIPIAYILAKSFSLGIIGIPIATILVMIGAGIICFIQYRKIIQNNAKGIWNK